VTPASTAADATTFPLTIKPACDQVTTRFGPLALRMDRGQLVIRSAKGDIRRFEESDSIT